MNYDLQKRVMNFSKKLIQYYKHIIKDPVYRSLIIQLIRSGTSVGANYYEANNSCSKKDFNNKIYICKKESAESMYWLELLEDISSYNVDEYKWLKQEIKELNLIFAAITRSLKDKVS